jgi:DNA (cytosine-5)-methyltransferase 1
MKPICFKIRGGVEREDGSRGSTNIGKMAGKGYLGSEDKAFTVISTQDQYLFSGQGNGSYTYPFNKPPMTQKKLKYLSLFSGIEAASVAWKSLGWEPVGFSEIEPFPSAVLKHHFPNTPNYGDITKWKDWGLTPGSVDLVCAGSPCQAFSTAGLRKGLDDPRGNLALVTLGLVEFLKPKWFIWENVPGVLTSGGERGAGSDFAALLTALGDIGYGWSYRILDAQHFGVAQRRRRVWLCGYRDPVTGAGDWRSPAAVLFDRESLRWNPSQGIGSRQASPRNAQKGAGEEGGAGCFWDGGQVTQTLDAVLAKGQTMPEKNRFPAVLVPEPVVLDRAAFNQGENAQYDPHIKEGEQMVTLVAKGPHAVGQPIPINTENMSPSSTSWGNTVGEPGDPQFAITKSHCQAVAQPVIVRTSDLRLCDKVKERSVCPSITSDNKGGDNGPLTIHNPIVTSALTTAKGSRGGCSDEAIDEITKVAQASNYEMLVRRLTERECERLQGFPDDHTKIPWKGKSADACPAGPRYKAIGNSWAVPCAKWIGERIAMVEAIHDEAKNKTGERTSEA